MFHLGEALASGFRERARESDEEIVGNEEIAVSVQRSAFSNQPVTGHSGKELKMKRRDMAGLAFFSCI